LRPSWRYASFDENWSAVVAAGGIASGSASSASGSASGGASGGATSRGDASPDGEDLAVTRMRTIARSVYAGDPRAWYPLVDVPVVLCPVVPEDGEPDPTREGMATRTGIAEATARLPRARVSWYYGDADILRTGAARLADDLLALAHDVEPAIV
jgi:hypothetical protein